MKLLARFHDFEVEQDGPYYSVVLPCHDHDYHITRQTDPELALRELQQFIDEAVEAKETLEALS